MEKRRLTKKELQAELETLRARVVELEKTDVERRRTEEHLRHQKELAESLIRSSPNGILAMDLEWRYTIWNPAMERLSGFPKERCLGRVAFEVFPFLDDVGLRPPMEAARAGESVVSRNQLYVEPGTDREVYFDAYYSPLRGLRGEIVGVLGIIPDVTERRRSEEALREAHHQLEARVEERTAALTHEIAERERAEAELRRAKEFSDSLIRSSVDGILAYDRDFCYTVWNPAMEDLTSVAKEEALGQNMFELFPFLKDIDADYMYAAFEGRDVILRDSPYKTPRTGAEGFFEAHYSPIRDTAGEIVGSLGIIRDVTERKQLEEERIRTSKLESLSLLAGGLAHDFNNLLAGIVGYVAIAAQMVEPGSKARQKLAAAEAACVRAGDLTEQLLTFAKGGMPVKETASLAELIRESAAFSMRGSNLRCQFTLADDLAPAEVDPGQISQVINNVIINACQAMPEGGTLQVEADNLRVDGDSPLPLAPGPYVRLSIRDQGIGMPEQILEKIFDPYFTTKQQGTGLGLATAYSIIKNHKGYISAESQVGTGSTFEIYLPSSTAAPPPRKTATAVSTGEARILVMDDDPVVRDVLRDILEYGGFEVTVTANGEDAVHWYREAREIGRPFDAVILDLTVRGGLGGAEALEQLKGLDPQVRAVVASGYSHDPVLAKFEDYGFRARLTKPYRPQALFDTLQQVLVD